MKAFDHILSKLKPESSPRTEPAGPMFDATDYSFGDALNVRDGSEDLPVGEFLSRFRDHGSESLCNAYSTNHPLHTSPISGCITTTLCEDVLSLVGLQLNVLHQYLENSDLLLTETGDAVLIDGLSFILRNLWYKQRQFRDSFLIDMESSCAAANDFFRMMEGTENLAEKLKTKYPHLSWREGSSGESPMMALSRKMSDLLSLYSGDAVYAAQRVHIFVFQSVNRSSIHTDLFGRKWEEKFTHNQVALSLVKTIEDYLSDAQSFLYNDFLYHKLVDALMKATVSFYVRCLVQKADRIRSRRNGMSPDGRLPFKDPSRACTRIAYDIQTIQKYFQGLAKDSPALARLVEDELSLLVVVQECLVIALGQSNVESLEHFIIVLHKRTGGNVMVTNYLLGDLWLLVAPPFQRRKINETLAPMESELQVISKIIKETAPSNSNQAMGLNLDEILKDIYEERMMQEASLCGALGRPRKHLAPEDRQEIHDGDERETLLKTSGMQRDPAAEPSWLDITDGDLEKQPEKEAPRQRNLIEELSVFFQEKILLVGI